MKGIAETTKKRFGLHQLDAYERIIERGLEIVGDNPERPGSIGRSQVAPDVRLFHLELAAGRRGAAAHCLYYTTGRMSNGAVGTIILRVLHEGMEPRYKVVRSLRTLKRHLSPADPLSGSAMQGMDSRNEVGFNVCG